MSANLDPTTPAHTRPIYHNRVERDQSFHFFFFGHRHDSFHHWNRSDGYDQIVLFSCIEQLFQFVGLTKALARELGPEIRVNAILPGAIATAMLDSAGGEDAMEPMKQMSPLKRIGRGREIGTVALFLATDDSSFITGQLIRVDGGVDV